MPAIVVVDLGFGDAGKGSLVDYYVRRHGAHTVVRFNGGAQAAHHVVTPEGRQHTFAQFGSGTLVPGVRTHLSRYMLVDPLALLAEERHLRAVGVSDAWARLTIDPGAVVVTPFQRAANRLRELARGAGRHGSCGMGIGETMADSVEDAGQVVRAGDLAVPARVVEKLGHVQELKRRQMAGVAIPPAAAADQELALLNDPAAAQEFAKVFAGVAGRVTLASTAEALGVGGTVVLEGAQGVLLDEWYGFHPYTTWSTTTFANALALLREAGYAGEVRRIGALRAYLTRHGPGPFVTEDAELSRRLPDAHNGTNPWQRTFRVGWMDLVMMRYALEVAGGADELAVTCVDRLAEVARMRMCERYEGAASPWYERGRLQARPAPNLEYQEQLTAMLAGCRPVYGEQAAEDYLPWLQSMLGIPITLASWGPTWWDKIWVGEGSSPGRGTRSRDVRFGTI
jgi:adenylosuccinate synthase